MEYLPPIERSVWEENIKHLVNLVLSFKIPATAGASAKKLQAESKNNPSKHQHRL